MLQINKSGLVTDQQPPAPSIVSPAELYAATVGFLRRQFSVIIFALLFVLAAGAFYLFTVPPRYTGHAVLVIDTHSTQFLQAQSQRPDPTTQTATVDTQIEILKSEDIATSVIQDLHLNDDPEFVSPSPGIIGNIVGFLTFMLIPKIPSFEHQVGGPTPEFRRMRTAIATLDKNLKVKRSGLTFAIDIDFKSLDPDRAAQVANAIA